MNTTKKYFNNIHISFAFLLIFATAWYLFATNSYSADIDSYRQTYYDSTIYSMTSYEIGFYSMCVLFNSWDVSFEDFQRIYGSIALLLIGSTILRYARKQGLVILYFLLYPFLLDCAQIRHLMAIAIFVFSIRYLEKFSIKNVVVFLILIWIATTFHIIAFAFLIFLITYIKTSKKLYFIVGVALTFLIYMGSSLKSTSLYIYLLDMRSKTGLYEENTRLGQMIMYWIFDLIISFFAIYKSHNRRNHTSNDNKDTIMKKISVISLLFIPLLIIDFQYTRLFRACLIPLYISATNNILTYTNGKRQLSFFILTTLLIAVSYKLFGPNSGYFELLTSPILFHK